MTSNHDEYTVAVVGGGPGGTTAAKTVRDYSDVDVVLLDEGTKRTDRGNDAGPDSTDAAGQLTYWLDDMPEWVVETFLEHRLGTISCAELHGPRDSAVVTRGDRFENLIANSIPASEPDVGLDSLAITFDRPGLDSDLLAAAKQAGVEVRVGARVGDVETFVRDGDPVHHLSVPGGSDVVAEYLVLADGPKRTATMATLEQFLDDAADRVHPANGNQHTARQYYVAPPNADEWTDDPAHTLMFFWGHIPGHTAYPWVFPLEDGVYEVGLTRPTDLHRHDAFERLDVDPNDWPLLDADDMAYPGDETIMQRLYSRVLGGHGDLTDHLVEDRGKHDGRESYVISSMRPFDSPTAANVAVVGGAGGFTSAFHEGGDHVAVYTGALAGELIGADDRSLRAFNPTWKRRFGYEIYPNVAFAELVEGFSPADFDMTFRSLVGENTPSSPSELVYASKLAWRFAVQRARVGEDVRLALQEYLPGGAVDRVWDAVVNPVPPPVRESEYEMQYRQRAKRPPVKL